VQLERCTVDDPHARPTASAVAAALAAAAPTARTIARPTANKPRRERPGLLSRRGAASNGSSRTKYRELAVIVVAAIGAVGVGVGVGRWPSSAPAEASPRTGGRASSTATTARRSPSTTSATTTAIAARRVWPPAPPHVLHANGTWTFGTDDDRVVVGDWDCDGVDTPALLQPDGDLYVIDAWTDDATARFVTTVDAARDARVEPDGSCDRLVIQTSDGRTITPSMDGS
jgi:hypothetical protein